MTEINKSIIKKISNSSWKNGNHGLVTFVEAYFHYIDGLFQTNIPIFTTKYCAKMFFLIKMVQSRPLFVYFRHFLITISIIEKA